MRYSDSSDLSKVSLLSLTLFIFSAGIVEVINPSPTRAASIRTVDPLPTLLLAQSTPQVNPAVTPQATSPVRTESSNREGGDGTLWWLLLLCLGLPFLLAWLGSRNRTTIVNPSTLILTPETGNTARIYWEISPEKIQRLQRQGGTNLAVRLTDVTNINPQVTTPEVVQQVPCSLGNPLISLEVPEVDREYQAELGCVTNDGGWISLAKSAPAYFPAPRPFLGGLGAGIVTAIGSNAISSLDAPKETEKSASLPQVEDKLADKVDAIDSSTPDAGVAVVIDNSASPTEGAENTEVSDHLPEVEKVEKVKIVDDPAEEVENTQVTDSSAEEMVEIVEIVDDSAGNLEVDIWNEQASPITTTVTTPVEPKSEIADPSDPEDLPSEEISPPLSSVVPTVDDGGSSLNWGVIGGAAAGVPELAKDEVVIETPLPRVNLIPIDQVAINGSWVLPESTKATYKSQGGRQLALRIYHVTGIDTEMPLTGDFRQFAVAETGLTSPLTLEDLPNNPSSNSPHSGTDSEVSYQDYQGELGYLTATEQWLGVAKSNRVRLSLVGKTQIQLAMHTPTQGYVTWTIAPRDNQILKSQEIHDLRLRIYDVTDIDLDHAPAHSTQEYPCEMGQRNCYVTITVGDRPHADYIAELGYITNTGEWLRIIRSLHTRFG